MELFSRFWYGKRFKTATVKEKVFDRDPPTGLALLR